MALNRRYHAVSISRRNFKVKRRANDGVNWLRRFIIVDGKVYSYLLVIHFRMSVEKGAKNLKSFDGSVPEHFCVGPYPRIKGA